MTEATEHTLEVGGEGQKEIKDNFYVPSLNVLLLLSRFSHV